jgi:hypothetical protein
LQENFRGVLKTHVKVRGSKHQRTVYSLQPSVLLAFLLVSGEQTFTENFAIPNERIEQMARKNDGASAKSNTSTAAPPDRTRQWRVEPAKILT